MDGYLYWIKTLIRDPDGWRLTMHTKLIEQLHQTQFLVMDPNDQAREDDGYDMRWRYAWEADISDDSVSVPYIQENHCSILEMMTALALRADENFTYSNNSAVSELFWDMVKNMRLLGETDNMYDRDNVTYRLDIFNNRMYEPNGYGGLFFFPEVTDEDMRNVSIWNQLCRWYNRRNNGIY